MRAYSGCRFERCKSGSKDAARLPAPRERCCSSRQRTPHESSIISYLTSRPSRDVVKTGRQAVTSEWWFNHRKKFEVYVSALVEEEISSGDPIAATQRIQAITDIPSVAITPDAEALARALVAAKAIPANSVRDALHIAVAATQGMDYLLTWNFKHINNAETKALIAGIVEASGLECPILCSPEELGGYDDEE